MYDLKIIFQLKENKLKELEFSFVWSKNSKKYLSSFFDTQEFLKVQNDIMKDFNCTKIQANKKLFADFKNVWNEYSKNWLCISCMAKVECLNCGKYNYTEILKDGLGKFCYCCHCNSTFDI